MAGKQCVANSVEFHPVRYQDESELEAILAQPGSVNVSRQYKYILLVGLYINVAFLVYFFLKRPLCSASGRGRPCIGLLPLLLIASLFHFFWMIYMRSFSFQGQVCSGDYSSFIVDEDQKRDRQYDDYYLRRLGKFFQLYPQLLLYPALGFAVGTLGLMWLLARIGATKVHKPINFEEKK